jgi:hypothetical protein
LVTLDKEHSSVADVTCRKCHPVGAHAAIELKLKEPACTECHQEHRPEASLVAVSDNACTLCHQGLDTETTKSEDAKLSFELKIRQFEEGEGGHPQFAIHRDNASVGERHALRRLATFADGNWIDRGGLVNFNHQLHLDPKRLRELAGDKRQAVEKPACADCHEMDPNGDMRPIVYEQHCRKCHPLQLAIVDGQEQDLPHSSVEE